MGKKSEQARYLSVTLDVWGVASSDPRGIVNLKRQYAKACALLAERQHLRLCYAGTTEDQVWLHQEKLLNHATFRRFRIPGRVARYTGLWRVIPVAKLLGSPDLYHSFTQFPFRSGQTEVIGTLVDFVPIRVPEYVPIEFTAQQISWCQWASQHPEAKWIAISEQTRQDALTLGRLKADQVAVVYPGVQDDMFIEPNQKEVSSTLDELGLRHPYMLCVNTLNPRKNHARLVAAWEAGEFSTKGWTLVLVGHAAGNPLAEALRTDQYAGVNWLGYTPRHQLRHLYYGCSAFLYPSLYEGYGIPVAEAAVAGKAVLTTKRSSMLEIVGQEVIQVDPLEVSSLINGIGQLIDDTTLRTRLAERSRSHRLALSVEAVAESLLSAYQSFQSAESIATVGKGV